MQNKKINFNLVTKIKLNLQKEIEYLTRMNKITNSCSNNLFKVNYLS